MMTCFGIVTVSAVTILWDNTQKSKDVTSETPLNVSVVTILDTFEPSSKMLIMVKHGSLAQF